MKKQLSECIHILKHYDKQKLLRIALPLGGIGTGTVSLGGRGELQDWEIMSLPQKKYSTVVTGNNAPFFAIYTKNRTTGVTQSKALLGPVHETEYDHHEGRSVDHHGFPRFRNASFSTSYPFGLVHLSDKTMPVKVTLVGYNPLIPGDANNSGIPIAILRYEIENISPHTIDVSLCGVMRNFVGQDGSKRESNWKGDSIPVGANRNVNEYKKSGLIEGIYMYSRGVPKDDPAWGNMALSTTHEKGNKISYRTTAILEPSHWHNAILDLWDDFSDDGMLNMRKNDEDDNPLAALAKHAHLVPKEKKTFEFYLTWYFPNRYGWAERSGWGESNVGNYYTTQYLDAWDVITKQHKALPSLTQKTLQFVNSFVASSYTNEIKEAALFNLSTLRSQTVFRTPDGKLFGWEGVMDTGGSCMGSCTHVWNYEQSTAFLFGSLAKTMREVEFVYSTNSEGKMSFRATLPLGRRQKYPTAAADGQMGCIMKFYREWQLSGDTEYLKKHWKKVKAALSFAWIKGGWDADKDGVMEGVQHNTMDVEYFGPNPQMQIWYLGALKAGEKMAETVEDVEFAHTCKTLFEHGSVWTDKNIFNGEYYFHKIQVPKSKEDIHPDIMMDMGSKDLKNPDFQLANGCLIDQLVGQYMAHILGLGYLVDKHNVKKTLQSIYKYNYREDFFEHFNNMRSYVLGDEKALLMASWPHGDRPAKPFPYWAEVMTGFEYTVAVGMIYEGMKKEGRQIIKNIRNRYNGYRRNPFDETECGRHYARAMAAWAGILVESKFYYSGVEKSISFTKKPGSYFWSNGYAWGTCIITKKAKQYTVKFDVLHGNVTLKNFSLENTLQKVFDTPKTVKENRTLMIHL